MRIRLQITLVFLLLGSGCAVTPAKGQMPSGFDLHERVDPISGLRWVEVRDSSRPAAPPHLALAPGDERNRSAASTDARADDMCVHAGDRLRIESRTASGGAITLEARALNGASCGTLLQARLSLTRAVVDAIPTGRGEATLVRRGDSKR